MKKLVHCLLETAHGPLSYSDLVSGGRGVTGSEQTMLYLAKAQAKSGYQVVCYMPTDKPGFFDGVEVLDVRAAWPRLRRTDGADVVIAWLTADFLRDLGPKTLRILSIQINDWMLSTHGFENFVDVYVAVSNAHKRWLSVESGAPGADAAWEILPNGVDVSRFTESKPRIKRRCVYLSSPDRGLHWVLAMWPEIHLAYPDAELHIFYEVQKWLDNATLLNSEIGQRARYAVRRLNELKTHGVFVRGAVSPKVLAEELSQADIMLYTCDPVRPTEGFCSPPGTNILMANGTSQSIENITVGTQVLGWGRPAVVADVSCRKYSGLLVGLKVCGWSEVLWLTPEHPVLVPWCGRSFRWVAAGSKPRRVAMVLPTGNCLKDIDLVDFDRGALSRSCWRLRIGPDEKVWYGARGSRVDLPRYVPVNEELCELVGWFLSEGTAVVSKGTTVFSLGGDEMLYAMRIRDLAWKVFGLSAVIKVQSAKGSWGTKSKLSVKIFSTLVARFFSMSFGTRASNKHLADWTLLLNSGCRRFLLRGLFLGDGYIRKFKSGAKACAAAVVTTVSRDLAYGVRILLLQEGCLNSCGYMRSRSSWDIGVNVRRAPWLAADFGENVVDILTRSSKTARILRQDGLAGFRAHWREKHYDGFVYDLSVPESRCYLAGPITIHNSVSTLEACAAGVVPIITDADALGEIYGESGAWVVPRGDTRKWTDNYIETVLQLFKQPELIEEARGAVRTFAQKYQWDDVARQWDAMIQRRLVQSI